MARLTEKQVKFYHENGFVQVDGLLSKKEVEELKRFIDEVLSAEADRSAGNTDESYAQVLHQRVNAWRDHGGVARYSFERKFAEMARQLCGADGIRFFHDHTLVKMPGNSKATAWHQDLPYKPMEDPRVLSIWIALTDVDENNGCMAFMPGSHKIDALKKIDLTDPEDIFELAEKHGDKGLKEREPVASRLKAGSCTFHNALTFHYAYPVRTDRPRYAFSVVYMPDGTTYNGKDNLVTRNLDLKDKKPYKGGLFPLLSVKEENTRTAVRPEKDRDIPEKRGI